MTAPLPRDPERPALHVVRDDERAPGDDTRARENDRGDSLTRPAAARTGVLDWIAVALLVMVGGAGLSGLLVTVLGPAVTLVLYAVAIAVPVCRYAATTRRRDGDR